MSKNEEQESNLAVYGEWGADEAEQETKEAEEESQSGFMRLKSGRNVVRFLPPRQGHKRPFVKIYQHYIRVPGRDRPYTFPCPRLELRQRCPACERADELKRTGNPEDYKMAGQFMARRRVFANVIDRAAPEMGPLVLGFGKTIHEALLALRIDEDAGGNYTHPVDGFDIVITRTGTGRMDTKYSVKPARKDTPLGDLGWLTAMHDLTRFTRVPTAEEIDEALSGATDVGGGGGRMVIDTQAEESPGGRRRRTRSVEEDIHG